MKYDYFIAARWRNKDNVLDLARWIRERGKSVYCFVEGDGTEYELKAQEESHDPEAFMQKFESIPDWKNSPAVREIFDVDMNALRDSHTLVLLLPAGKSAHVEAGAAYGMGKECVLIGEQSETESLYLIFSKFFTTVDDFLKTL